jgi:hypothetical protein
LVWLPHCWILSKHFRYVPYIFSSVLAWHPSMPLCSKIFYSLIIFPGNNMKFVACCILRLSY